MPELLLWPVTSDGKIISFWQDSLIEVTKTVLLEKAAKNSRLHAENLLSLTGENRLIAIFTFILR